MVEEMIGRIETPILHIDNQTAIKLIQHQYTKHIDIRYHYIREVVERGVFTTEYVSSKEQLADVLTKPLCN